MRCSCVSSLSSTLNIAFNSRKVASTDNSPSTNDIDPYFKSYVCMHRTPATESQYSFYRID